MLGRIQQLIHLIPGFSLLRGFRLPSQSFVIQVYTHFLFLDSVHISCVIFRVYPFHLDLQICWHTVVYTALLIVFISVASVVLSPL